MGGGGGGGGGGVGGVGGGVQDSSMVESFSADLPAVERY